jgi:hypothetical protein
MGRGGNPSAPAPFRRLFRMVTCAAPQRGLKSRCAVLTQWPLQRIVNQGLE